MKPSQLLPGLVLTMSAGVACAPERGATTGAPAFSEIENVEWTLLELDGAAIASASRAVPTLTFSSKDRRAQGFAGCNRFFGGYQVSGDQLHIGPLAMTRMACPEPTSETALIKALHETATWRIDGRTLELRDASATPRCRWTATAIESGDGP
jgi:heat shock protein HslJ